MSDTWIYFAGVLLALALPPLAAALAWVWLRRRRWIWWRAAPAALGTGLLVAVLGWPLLGVMTWLGAETWARHGPGPDLTEWHGQVLADGRVFELPVALRPAVLIDPAVRLPLPAGSPQRYYHGWRSTASGFPEHELVFEVLPVTTAHAQGMPPPELLGWFRAQSWLGIEWDEARLSGDLWWDQGQTLPMPQGSGRRFLRARLAQPQQGLWMGVATIDGHLPPEALERLLRRAADSVPAEPR